MCSWFQDVKFQEQHKNQTKLSLEFNLLQTSSNVATKSLLGVWLWHHHLSEARDSRWKWRMTITTLFFAQNTYYQIIETQTGKFDENWTCSLKMGRITSKSLHSSYNKFLKTSAWSTSTWPSDLRSAWRCQWGKDEIFLSICPILPSEIGNIQELCNICNSSILCCIANSQDDRQNKWNKPRVGKYQRDSFRSCSCTQDETWSAGSVDELCLPISDRNTQRISGNNESIGHQAGQIQQAWTQNIGQIWALNEAVAPVTWSGKFASVRVKQHAGKTVDIHAIHRFSFISCPSFVAELEYFTNLKCLVNVRGFFYYLKVTMWILLIKSHLDNSSPTLLVLDIQIPCESIVVAQHWPPQKKTWFNTYWHILLYSI